MYYMLSVVARNTRWDLPRFASIMYLQLLLNALFLFEWIPIKFWLLLQVNRHKEHLRGCQTTLPEFSIRRKHWQWGRGRGGLHMGKMEGTDNKPKGRGRFLEAHYMQSITRMQTYLQRTSGSGAFTARAAVHLSAPSFITQPASCSEENYWLRLLRHCKTLPMCSFLAFCQSCPVHCPSHHLAASTCRNQWEQKCKSSCM